jgi:hypothetical protein
VSSGFSMGEVGSNMHLGSPRPPQELIQQLLASRQPAQAQFAAPDDQIQLLYHLADGIKAIQQQGAQRSAVETLSEKVDMLGPRGITKFQNQQLQKPRSSSSEAGADSISIKESKESKPQKKPIRFFNAGMEVSIDGRPVANNKSVPCAEKQAKGKEKSRKRRKKRKASDVAEEEEKRQEEVQNLQDQQRSIWDAFVLEGDEKTKEKKKSKEKKGNEQGQMIDPSQLYSEITDTSRRMLSGDPSKIATASMDDIIKDSLTERQNTLSAASVLMALTPREKR